MQDLTAAAGAAWGAVEVRTAPAPEAEQEARFNPNHNVLGEFSSAGSSGSAGGGKSASLTAGKSATELKLDAQRRHSLLQRASDDRKRAHALEEQLHQIEAQIKHNTAVAKKAAASAHKKIAKNPGKGKKTAAAAHKTAHHTTAHHSKVASALQTQAGHLRTEIKQLLSQASALDAKAKKV